jgi:hypothetical protein
VSAIILAVGGLALFATFATILVIQAVHLVNGEPFTLHWFMFVVMAVAIGAISSGLVRIGVSYRFDGPARTFHREMLFGLVGYKNLAGERDSPCAVEDCQRERGRMVRSRTAVGDVHGSEWEAHYLRLFDLRYTPDPIQVRRDGRSRGDCGRSAAASVPVVVEGVVVKGRKELAALLTSPD